MAKEFKPFGGELAEEKPAPQFVRHASDSVEDPGQPEAPSPAPIVPAEPNDLAGQLRAILQDQLDANLAEDTLKNVVQSIEQTVNSTPSRLALPDLRLQDTPEPATEGESTPREKPDISVQKEENRVNRIQVNCTCGETMVMDVLY